MLNVHRDNDILPMGKLAMLGQSENRSFHPRFGAFDRIMKKLATFLMFFSIPR